MSKNKKPSVFSALPKVKNAKPADDLMTLVETKKASEFAELSKLVKDSMVNMKVTSDHNSINYMKFSDYKVAPISYDDYYYQKPEYKAPTVKYSDLNDYAYIPKIPTNPCAEVKYKTAKITPEQPFSDDPIANAQEIAEKALDGGQEIQQLPDSHQLLVVIEICEDSGSKFKERAARLLGSLNTTSTIKADVISVTDGKMYEGLHLTKGKPGGKDFSGLPPGKQRNSVCILQEAKGEK